MITTTDYSATNLVFIRNHLCLFKEEHKTYRYEAE